MAAKRRSEHRRGTNPKPVKIPGLGFIHCDEAGFTGNNLLDETQEVFAFAGVALDTHASDEIVARTIRDFRLQGAELKGSRLLKTDVGRKAITAVLKECAPVTRAVVHLKKFALACKFFEYIYEPALAEQNSIFYSVGFHTFIANLLFAHLRASVTPAEAIFADFSEFMREGNEAALERVFPNKSMLVDFHSDPIAAISLFAMLNRHSIVEELNDLRGDGTAPNWVLDLTTTSLFAILSHFGEVYDQLDVYCDRSKPLETEHGFLRAMIGRTEHVRLQLFEKDRQYTFNLLRLPTLVNSRLDSGVQIADVFASSIASAFQQQYRGKADESDRNWLAITRECLLEDNVWPDLSSIDLGKRSGFVNCLILLELANRCVKRESLFSGMPSFIQGASSTFPEYRRRQLRPKR